MSTALVATPRVATVEALPRSDAAMQLFEPHLPCDEGILRRVYLQLALRYHPDKWPADDRPEATALFQAIAAVYEKLTKPMGRLVKRVKSPVAAAAELGDLEELRRLLEAQPGRAVEEDDLGATPLMFAARGGCIEAAELLVRHGAEVHARSPIGWSALTWAGLGDQAPMVRWLVGKGMKVAQEELNLVAFAGHASSLAALLDSFSGSVASVRTDTNGQTLLHLVCYGLLNLPRDSPERYLSCAELLAARGVPVDAKDKRGRTCLHIFVGHSNWALNRLEASGAHMQMVEWLCARGSSPGVVDDEGSTALSLAEFSGLHQVREALQRFSTGRTHVPSKL